jgi:hypothetical protein
MSTFCGTCLVTPSWWASFDEVLRLRSAAGLTRIQVPRSPNPLTSESMISSRTLSSLRICFFSSWFCFLRKSTSSKRATFSSNRREMKDSSSLFSSISFRTTSGISTRRFLFSMWWTFGSPTNLGQPFYLLRTFQKFFGQLFRKGEQLLPCSPLPTGGDAKV